VLRHPVIHEKTVLVLALEFRLVCLPNTHNTHESEGYLFVCPPEDFQTKENLFRWPDNPAFWSLDSSGAVPLNAEGARNLGFPILQLHTVAHGLSWDRSVYDALGRFHRGKGFNPESQEVAIHLGYPLYELSSEAVSPWAFGERE
jgi:hypothetical protein